MVEVLKQRFWEIDFLRGLAIIMMIIFHFFYDLNYFDVLKVSFSSGFWWIFARIIVTIFILLVGISLTLSYSRVKKQKKGWRLFKKYFLRGLKIFGWGLIITVITWSYLKRGFIVFGVLHFIGVSIILVYPFLKLRFWNFILGIIFILIGIYIEIENIVFNSYSLIWLGLKPYYFYSVDYMPIFPWFGVILLGLFLGKMLYPEGKRRLKIKDLSNFSFVKLFSFLGRNSLLIYLLHQPILVIFLYLFVL